DERARRLVHILEPNRPQGPVRRVKWTGRVPDELAKAADPKGQLSVEAVEAYYRKHHPYLSLESRQMFLEPAVVTAAKAAATKVGLRSAPTLVYLADRLADAKGEVPYAVVAALDPTL